MKTPQEIAALRERLGLTQAQFAAAYRMGGQGKRRVRGWENGEMRTNAAGERVPVVPSGPARVALELTELIGPERFREYLATRDK